MAKTTKVNRKKCEIVRVKLNQSGARFYGSAFKDRRRTFNAVKFQFGYLLEWEEATNKDDLPSFSDKVIPHHNSLYMSMSDIKKVYRK